MNTVEFLSYLRSLDIQVSVSPASSSEPDGDYRLRCNAPEGVLTPDLRNQLAARKAEVIAFLRSAKANVQPVEPLATPMGNARSQTTAVPLSFAQQRLWFLEQLVPGNPFYNVPTAVRLTGAIDLPALEQTFNEILRRHDVLRTRFRLVDGSPVQEILPTLSVDLAIVDLPMGSPEQPEVQDLMRNEAQRPFNLAEDTLLRIKLLRLGAIDSILLLTLHHIVADGWSMGVLIREVGVLYAAFAAGEPSPLPDLPTQYAAFAQRQRDWMRGEVLDRQLGYWKRQLADLPLLDLPTDYPRPPIQSYRGATQALPLSRSIASALESLSQQAGATLFMTLLAAFQTLLYRYTGQEDIAVGSPIANRNRSEIEDLIGFFVNSLVLRTDLSGNPTFRELLGRVRSIAFAAYAHQDLPFERLVEELQPDRDLSRNPLFQVVFALQNAPSTSLNLPDITIDPIDFDPGTTRFDLEFHVSSSTAADAGLNVLAVYNTDLFAEETIARLLEHFQILLESVVANPDQPIAQLPILTSLECDRLLPQNPSPYPKQCVHHQFEAQVDRTPHALALASPAQQFTYQELNRRSNQLAHYLRSIGVTSETIVGICLDRSPNWVVAVLGILKAGGAYLPIDPAYPRDRIAFMCKDASLSLLLGRSIADLPGVRHIDLDRWDSIASHSPENPAHQATTENLAYVIYTSGSTGQPKGVLVEHGSLANLIFWHRQAFEIGAGVEQSSVGDHRASQIAGVGFDACGWEIFPYLAAGASVHFPDEETRTSPPQLQRWLIEQEITVSFLPTPLAERVFALDWSTPAALRVLLTGGDKLRQSPPALPFAIVNNYGLTESTVVATSGRVTSDEAPTIGKPIANTQIYLLDAQMQPVPIGARGEIFVGGDGLARGYLDRPDLTADRFVTTPYGRLYRTGDLGRYRADGNLEFLGRIDSQVQRRGCRIELGEIEAVLAQHPGVGEAIVTAQDSAGELQIVAYVTPQADESAPQLQDEQVLQWQMLYEETYSQPAPDADPTFNRVGWNSSYTGQPLPGEQIREWVDRRVEQILAFQPQRVLEIGCGTGLLLFQLAPHCSQYWGTDFSQVSIDYIQQQLTHQSLPQVTLLERVATDFTQIEPASFDAVVLNSVVQYFPSIEYLLEVLTGAIETLAPGGFVFLGDIRSLPLLQTLHTAIQFYQADPSTSQQELQQRIQTQIFQESELLIDPAFFHALRQRFRQIDRVQIHLTRGQHHNEMTQFRYNVTLHLCDQTSGTSTNSTRFSEPLHWTENQMTLAAVRQRLQAQPDCLAFTQIPNARLAEAVRASDWLATANPAEPVAACPPASRDGIDPEDLIALAQDFPYRVALAWSDGDSARVAEQHRQGRYDACFIRKDVAIDSPQPDLPLRPWQTYANNPLRAKLAAHLVPLLRSHLGQKLPDFMLPSSIVVLEELPLTPNGKIDRKALPAPEFRPQTAFVSPRLPVEQQLAEIWCGVLGLKSVGTNDNFFELGGHSLLATQLVSRVRDAFQIELPLRTLFEMPTIEQLAIEIERLQRTAKPQAALGKARSETIAPLSREAHRVKLSALTNPRPPAD